jgi:hypothetical protein
MGGRVRAPDYIHLSANGTTVISAAGTNPRLGIVVINTKGVGNTLTLHDADSADATKIIAIIDTTVAIGPLDYGQLALRALTAVLAGGTPADVTVSWG